MRCRACLSQNTPLFTITSAIHKMNFNVNDSNPLLVAPRPVRLNPPFTRPIKIIHDDVENMDDQKPPSRILSVQEPTSPRASPRCVAPSILTHMHLNLVQLQSSVRGPRGIPLHPPPRHIPALFSCPPSAQKRCSRLWRHLQSKTKDRLRLHKVRSTQFELC